MTDLLPYQIRVRLDIDPKDRKLYPYHGQSGYVLCGAGNGGVWVRLDGQPEYEYTGVPIRCLRAADAP